MGKGVKKMSVSIHTAKIDRELIKAFSRRRLKVSKTAINLLFHLCPFVDRDGRIYLDKEYIRKQLYCDRRTLEAALLELSRTSYNGKNLLSIENGHYISHFHVATDGKIPYLKHLPFYNNPEFLNLTKNQTRLFLYVATLNIHNQYSKVAIENLYKNKLHDLEFGMHVYDDYKSMTDDLFTLIELELIDVRLPEKKEQLDKNNSKYREIFHSYFGYSGSKKTRTSKYQKNNHTIGLRINKKLFGDKDNKIGNIASEAEIRLLADRYHMFHEDMNPETFNFFTGKKKKLIEQFGKSGIEIYRASLEKYFGEKHENIVYYDLSGKAVNYFTDFYLLEEVKKVILAGLHMELDNKESFADTGYSFTETNIPLLVEYFITNSSDEHKVLLDQDILKIKDAHEIMSGLAADEPWTSLQASIDAVYSEHLPKLRYIFEEACDKNGITDVDVMFSKISHKELISSLAKEHILSQRKDWESQAEKLKHMIRFFRTKDVPFSYMLKNEEEEEIPEQDYIDINEIGRWLES